MKGKDAVSKLHNAYMQLQGRVNALYDSDRDTATPAADRIPGLRQLIEKKQGSLFLYHSPLSSKENFFTNDSARKYENKNVSLKIAISFESIDVV